MEEIVNALLPAHPIRTNAVDEKGSTEKCPHFTTRKVEEVVLSMKDNKALGSDSISSEVLKLVSTEKTGLLLSAFNACLTTCVLAFSWKVASLMLLIKGKGDPVLGAAYRHHHYVGQDG